MKAQSRRAFLKSASLAAGAVGVPAGALGQVEPRTEPCVLGPRPGYSPMIGTLVSELNWVQMAVVRPPKKFTVEDLDWLFDANANSIGALLLHLAATETYYGLHTFGGVPWDSWSAEVKAKWDPAMNLGDAGRKTIKGHDLAFYLDTLKTTREHTLAEFSKRDDKWLMAVDEKWPWGPTDTLCKWFHVAEHISHHAGQIDLIAKRLPSEKGKPVSAG